MGLRAEPDDIVQAHGDASVARELAANAELTVSTTCGFRTCTRDSYTPPGLEEGGEACKKRSSI